MTSTENLVTWRGAIESAEVDRLHGQAFGTTVASSDEADWAERTERHSLGWVTARSGDGSLVGFANVAWDGLRHAWLVDLVVGNGHRHRGIGKALVEIATDAAASAGCDYLHVDFEPDLAGFYLEACGFAPARAGLMRLR